MVESTNQSSKTLQQQLATQAIDNIHSLLSPQRFLELLRQNFANGQPDFFDQAEKYAFEAQSQSDFLFDEHNMLDTVSQKQHYKGKKKKAKSMKYKSPLAKTKQENESLIFTDVKTEEFAEQDFGDDNGEPIQADWQPEYIVTLGIKLEALEPDPEDELLHKCNFLGYELKFEPMTNTIKVQYGFMTQHEKFHPSILGKGFSFDRIQYKVNGNEIANPTTPYLRFQWNENVGGRAKYIKEEGEDEIHENWKEHGKHFWAKTFNEGGKANMIMYQASRMNRCSVKHEPAGIRVWKCWENWDEQLAYHLNFFYDADGKFIKEETGIEE